MLLESVTFRNFRNYESLSLRFSANMNLIAGGNAQGKTNILEGIYFLSTAKSHRTNRDNELIQYGKKWFYLKGQVSSKNLSTVVEIINTCDEKKKIRINGKTQGRISSIIGKINTVMFSPEDLSLVKGAPSERRRFLDILISRISPSYLHRLQEYQSALRQRNELLKKIRDGRKGGGASCSFALYNSLDSWNALLIEAGSEIVKQRISIVSELAELAVEKHGQLTSSGEELCVKYQSQLVDTKHGDDGSDLNELYEKSLNGAIDLDIRQGSTSVGPHRDDLVFAIDSADVRKFCSQGQQRTSVLSLKLADLELMNLKLGEYPVVLLDDVTSELDDSRVAFLFDLLSKIPVQMFLTTTDLHGIPASMKGAWSNPDRSSFFIVENGRCEGWECGV